MERTSSDKINLLIETAEEEAVVEFIDAALLEYERGGVEELLYFLKKERDACGNRKSHYETLKLYEEAMSKKTMAAAT